MGELTQKSIASLKARRQNLLDGGVNSIPSPFPRFSNDFIGLEKATYYLITSFTKGGKSQFVSYLLYEALMFEYYSKVNIKITILYFPLEETPERIMNRFMSWLLYDWTKGKVRISPSDLRSSKNDRPLPQEVLDILESDEIQDILNFFEEHIIFSTETNPTGIYKFCKDYAEKHGTVTTKPTKFRDENGMVHEAEGFGSYTPDNPDEYVFPVIDTINITDTERGFNKKQSIDKLSEYLAKYLRNRYGQSPIVIQQQNTDNESVESVKFNRTRPSVAGLGDSKYTGHDANIVFGIFSPFKFGLKEYLGYQVDRFKDHLRFLEIVVNRDGELGGITALFFDGAVCNWTELPKPNDTTELDKVYKYLASLYNPPKLFFMVALRNFVKRLQGKT